jgi:hypothetical protein
MVWVSPNEPLPGEPPRNGLPDRSWAHFGDGGIRAQELEMIASHANVASLNLPPDLIALAYDRNDGELIDTFVNLTEPISRRELERELAERQATEHEEEESNQRELDLWLLESQVPGCTRERAERAYAQGQEDVSRALPLVRMATLLADRDEMVDFLMEMQPGGLRVHAEDCYDETDGDIVDAVVDFHQRTARSRNEEPLRDRCLHRLRIRAVFALALLYRERYGQLQPEASAAIAQTPLVPRERLVQLPSFTTPDGVRWTYSSQRGWERRMALEPIHVGRAAQATEQLARLADARGQAQTAARARQTAAGMRSAQSAIGHRRTTPQEAIGARVARENMRHATEIIRTYMRNDALVSSTELELAHPRNVGFGGEVGWRTVDARARIDVAAEREQTSETSQVESDTNDDDDDDDGIPDLAEHSGSSEYDDDEENEVPTAGAYARPRAFVRFESLSRRERTHGMVTEIKRNLRTVQEKLDEEMANANKGIVMSEGAYLCMMQAVKKAWESTEKLSS